MAQYVRVFYAYRKIARTILQIAIIKTRRVYVIRQFLPNKSGNRNVRRRKNRRPVIEYRTGDRLRRRTPGKKSRPKPRRLWAASAEPKPVRSSALGTRRRVSRATPPQLLSPHRDSLDWSYRILTTLCATRYAPEALQLRRGLGRSACILPPTWSRPRDSSTSPTASRVRLRSRSRAILPSVCHDRHS